MTAKVRRGTGIRKRRQRGRPVEKPLPEPIPDTPENVARALVSTPPKDEDDWDYLKGREIELQGTLLRREKKD